nr:unnamed protein product [Digitaria exilis]
MNYSTCGFFKRSNCSNDSGAPRVEAAGHPSLHGPWRHPTQSSSSSSFSFAMVIDVEDEESRPRTGWMGTMQRASPG